MRTRTLAGLYAVPLVTAAIGYAISRIVSAPIGAAHSCPALLPGIANPPYRCAYPPDTARWALEWTAGGLVAGVVLVAIIWAVLRAFRPAARS